MINLNFYLHATMRQVALAALLWMTQASADPALDPFEGMIADAGFNLPDLQEVGHDLRDYRGKVVLVNFWATWCAPCVYEMPELERLKETLDDASFEILAINVGEHKFRVWKFIKLVGLELPVLLDTRKEVFAAWHLKVLPTSFLLDRNGRIRYRVQAVPQWDNDATLSVIRGLLRERETSR